MSGNVKRIERAQEGRPGAANFFPSLYGHLEPIFVVPGGAL